MGLPPGDGEDVDAGKAPAAEGMGKVERDALLMELFGRYDMDASGTLNTPEELKMLTTNVLFKLKAADSSFTMLYSPEFVTAKLAAIGQLDDENAWSPGTYIAWFEKVFLAPAHDDAAADDDGGTSTDVDSLSEP